MTTVDKFDVVLEGAFSAILRKLKAWTPQPAKSESQYQQQLADFLRACAPAARVEREFAHMGCKVDVYFKLGGFFSADEILFEAKLNLNSENEYKRLVGQIETMEPKKHPIMVVLFGKTKPELLARLKEKYPERRGVLITDGHEMAILEKPVVAARAKN